LRSDPAETIARVEAGRHLLRNGVRPHSALANETPEEFRAQHIAVAAGAGNGHTFNLGLFLLG